MTVVYPISTLLLAAAVILIWAHFGLELVVVLLLIMAAVVIVSPVKRVDSEGEA